jgi:GNAT superfamily N-acetyltransferase
VAARLAGRYWKVMPDPEQAPGAFLDVEENAAGFLLALAKATGAEVRRGAVLEWAIGGGPIDYHNCVVRAVLDEAAADEAIRESIERFRAHAVAGSWHVGPSMRPADLPTRLLAHGFVRDAEETGMVLDLAEWAGEPGDLRDVSVRLVRDLKDLAAWEATLTQGFGAGPHEARWVASAYRRIGLGDLSFRHYLAVLGGDIVGTGTLFLAPRSAGLYFVFTLPSARRRGVGRAITSTMLADARSLGARRAVLSASAMGRPLYAELGFRACCTVEIYVWSPDGGR